MNADKLKNIKASVAGSLACADRIMDGGDNYDGAPAAKMRDGTPLESPTARRTQ